MQMIDLLLIGLLALASVFAVRQVLRKKKGGCCGSCDSCNSGDGCAGCKK